MAVVKGREQSGLCGVSTHRGSHVLHRRLEALARTALVLAIGTGLPAMASAGDAPSVQPSLHDGRQPALVRAKNGIPVVNIVAPGKQGVSHNTYTHLDVGRQGLIFNNGPDISKTRLAGYVAGNTHLVASGSASIILNEVVSTRPSQLHGYMEIAGAPAELVVANPNGITCDGCGFINTPRAILTTGTPVAGADGGLSGFRVTRGRINIRGAGLDASHIDRVDLLARAVDVNAKLWAQRLNVVAGANRIAHGDLAVTPIDGSGDKPGVAIDVAALGGMYANAIRLVGTEAGVGVNIEGEAAAQAGDFVLTSAGKVVIDGHVTATGTVTVGAAQSVDIDGVLASGGGMDVRAHTLNLAGTVYSDKGIILDADGDVRNQGQVQAHTGSLAISAGGKITNTATGVLYAGKDIGIDAGALANAGGIEATHTMQVYAANALVNQGVLQANKGDLSVQAQTLENTGTWSAHDDIDAIVTARFDTSGTLIADRNVTLRTGNLVTSGTVQAGKRLSLTTASVANSGKLQALGGPWHADIAGAFSSTTKGDIYAADTLTLTAQSFDNAGSIEAVDALKADTRAALTNSGVMQSDQAGLNLDGNQLTNTGTWSAAGNLALTAGTDIDTAGTVQAGGTLVIDAGGDLDNTGTLYAAGGLDITAATLHNANVLRSATGVNVKVAGAAGNTGTAYGLTASRWQVGGALDNTGVLASGGDTVVAAASVEGDGTLAAGLGSDGTLVRGGNLEVATSKVLQATGRNLASGNLSLSGGVLELAGSQTFAGGDARLAAKAGDIVLAGATLAARGAAAFTASGRLVNGGASAADGGQINASSLSFDVAGIDNGYGTIKQTGDADLIIDLAGAFGNAHGVFAVNAVNLTLAAAALDNTGGSLQHAGDGLLTLASTGRIDNTGGTIAGNGTLALHAAGALDNATGTIDALQAATVRATTLDNAGGKLAAKGLAVTVAGQLDNTSGTLTSTATLDLAAGSLVNGADGAVKETGDDALDITLTGTLTNAADAFIGSNGEVGLTAAQLVNAGQLYAGGDLSATTTDGSLDNTGGELQAMGSLVVDSATDLTNTSGDIEAGADDTKATLAVHAASVDNHVGRLANAGTGDTTLAIDGIVGNQGGTLGGAGDVTLTAANLANGSSGKLSAGRDLNLALAGMDNTGGTVYAARNLTWSHGDATLGNAGGNLGAGGNLDLDLGQVDNTDGNLDAGSDATLVLAGLDGAGRVVAGYDLHLTLSGDYTNGSGNTLKANHDLALTVGGRFDNSADVTLEAAHGLAIRAAGLTNAADARINSAATSVAVSGNLANAGRIEGDSVTLKAAKFTNTGDVMGGDVTVQSGQLVNGRNLGKVTDNTPYQTALIAATHSLNLYVSGTLLNQDANLFTLGDMTLAKNAAGDRSRKIINRSGDIEAGGNLVIVADQVTNERRYYKFETFPVSGGAGAGGGGANTHSETTSGIALGDATQQIRNYCSAPDKHGWQCLPGGTVTQTDTWTVTSVTRITQASVEGRILADGDIVLDGSLVNDASTLSAGDDLAINGHAQIGEVSTGTVGGGSVRNLARTPTVGVAHQWSQSIKIQQWKSGGVFGGHHWKTRERPHVIDFHDTDPPDSGDMSWISVDLGPTLSAHITAGHHVSLNTHDIHNDVVNADGHPVEGAIALGRNSGYRTVSSGTFESTGSVSKGGAAGGGVALGDVPTNASATPSPPQTVASLTGPDAHVPLPQSGLYTIHKSPNSSYLVETDPRFADYAHFISSDYMLDHLGYDPAAVDKRLGDGFYEERQVLDQITQLTGRRFLTADTDALDQYRALMDNAVEVAGTFHLDIGVALTAGQMAGLTRDIVWLVREEVDGQSVLVPVVYLSRKHAQQLTRSGAIIAGRNVILDTSGDITNSGTIVAGQSASLKADHMLNSGSLAAGGNLGIQAAHDILNQGGIIKGADVSLVAGNDVISRADIGPVDLGGVNLGAIGTGRITATHALFLQAGRDVSLGTVSIKAGDTLHLSAGRDLTATASHLAAGHDLKVQAGRDVSLDATQSRAFQGNAHHFTVTTTHHVTHLDAGGTLTVTAGRDLTSHGATLKAGDALNLAAGRDLKLAAVGDHTHTFDQWHHGRTSGTTVTDDDTLRGTTLTGTRGVNLSAGRNATLTATQVDSAKGDVMVQAGQDIHLNAGHEEHDWSQDTRTHHSSLLSSSTTTTHDASDNSLAVGTQLQGGQVNLAAGRNLTSQGATVQARQGLLLVAGHDVALGATDNVYRSQHYQHITHSHFGIDLITGVGDGQLYTKTTDDQQDMAVDHEAVGTLLSGDTIHVTAGHDLTAVGAQVAATHDLSMLAGHDLTIAAAADTHVDHEQHKHKISGFQRSGLVSMVGTTKTRQRARNGELSYTGSLIGSNQGVVSLVAGRNLHVTGSDVISQTGTTITGRNVAIDAAEGRTDSQQEYSMHRAGVMAGLGGMVGGLTNSAVGTYRTAQQAGRAHDKRLKALYAAKVGYQAYDIYKGANAYAGSNSKGGMGGTGVSLKISLGASTANSHADTHGDITYGSAIRSQGDVDIAATNGDLDVIGSQIKGNNVALAASHDINLLSQAEKHTQKQSGAHAGGQVGVSIGQTTGIFLSVNGGKARAHGNGTTHTLTTVDAADTLSLSAGRDATLKGAQARGNTIRADVGHNLMLESQQDTGDFASKQWNAGLTLVYGYSNGSVGVSGHASAAGMNHHYKSVTQVTGLAAGDGGFQIHVGGNTDLTGAVIASTANPDKNELDTGNLSWSNLHNEAKYNSWSASVGGGAGANPMGQSMAGLTGGLGIPQSHDQSSTTRAGIAQGTITIRNGNAGLAGLDRNPDIDAKGLTDKFNRQKLGEEQQMGNLAGYVGMRTVGAVAEHEQKQAAIDLATAKAQGNGQGEDAAQVRLDHWSDGGAYKTLLHGMVGAATASLGGGNALQGALGATASEAASKGMEQYLIAHGIDPTSPNDPTYAEGKSLMALASAVVGGMAGQGAGAATALQGEKYNRQLHPTEIAWIKAHAKAFAEQQCGGCDLDSKQIEQATAALAQAALRKVDLTWRLKIPATAQTQAASQYLQKNVQGTFINQTGQEQGLFTTEGNQFVRQGLYAGKDADIAFYRTYAQPGATRSLTEGFKQDILPSLEAAQMYQWKHPLQAELQSDIALGTGLLQFADHPLKSTKSWLRRSAQTFGETADLFGIPSMLGDEDTSRLSANRINTIYGSDVANQARLTGVAASAWDALQVVGAGKLADGAARVSGKAALEVGGKAADKVAVYRLTKTVNWGNITGTNLFDPKGIEPTSAVMQEPQVQDLKAAILGQQGMKTGRATELTQEYIKSGATLPIEGEAGSDTVLVKYVPKGGPVSDNTGYWMTPQQAEQLQGKSWRAIAKALGLPAESAKSLIEKGGELVAIRPESGKTPTVFSSRIAHTSEGRIKMRGGGRQIIVPDRSQWTKPQRNVNLQDLLKDTGHE